MTYQWVNITNRNSDNSKPLKKENIMKKKLALVLLMLGAVGSQMSAFQFSDIADNPKESYQGFRDTFAKTIYMIKGLKNTFAELSKTMYMIKTIKSDMDPLIAKYKTDTTMYGKLDAITKTGPIFSRLLQQVAGLFDTFGENLVQVFDKAKAEEINTFIELKIQPIIQVVDEFTLFMQNQVLPVLKDIPEFQPTLMLKDIPEVLPMLEDIPELQPTLE